MPVFGSWVEKTRVTGFTAVVVVVVVVVVAVLVAVAVPVTVVLVVEVLVTVTVLLPQAARNTVSDIINARIVATGIRSLLFFCFITISPFQLNFMLRSDPRMMQVFSLSVSPRHLLLFNLR